MFAVFVSGQDYGCKQTKANLLVFETDRSNLQVRETNEAGGLLVSAPILSFNQRALRVGGEMLSRLHFKTWFFSKDMVDQLNNLIDALC